ncbi:hypothetical protein F5X99DRAFT_404075 [Biscogniauxia marginata]|nr:hypothetical protein F5X99DRAFT_404075 [Biscogniauxia marginata]
MPHEAIAESSLCGTQVPLSCREEAVGVFRQLPYPASWTSSSSMVALEGLIIYVKNVFDFDSNEMKLFNMILSRHHYGGFVLTTVCFFFLFLTSKRLGEWSIPRPFYRVPSFRYPYDSDQVGANSSTWSGYDTGRPPLRPYDPVCDTFPNVSNILVVVKTGASESYAKIPTQLMTNLRCVEDFLLFSDMRQRIAGFDIHDSLETVVAEAKEGNADFDLYHRQKACPIDQENCHFGNGYSSSSEAWNLDKYKNIHIAEKTYHMRPNYDWYLFIDADSYVLWHNLSQWLPRLDPTKKLYIGSVTLIGGFRFAHGGSGYLLSQAAMHEFVGSRMGTANRFDARIKDSCCGDYMLGVALNETTGIHVSQAWPTINGEKPHTMPFGPKEWCNPMVTMHHVNSEEMSSFWEFEKRFFHSQVSSVTHQRSLVFKDIYEEFLAAKLQPMRQDWDNLSEDVHYLDPEGEHDQLQLARAKKEGLTTVEKNAHKSFEHCQKMCDKVKDCFQFSYHSGICAYHKGFLLGKPKKKTDKENERWMSGWAIDKINAWVQKQGQCKEPVWPKV